MADELPVRRVFPPRELPLMFLVDGERPYPTFRLTALDRKMAKDRLHQEERRRLREGWMN